MSTAARHTHTGKSRKKLLQRLYRSTEAEDFSQLRHIIKEITQKNLHTRHDILMKAAEIIRQLDADYRSLLGEQAASASNSAVSSTSSPMQHPAAIYPVSHAYGPPESWSVNHDLPISMHPYMFPSPNVAHTSDTGSMYYAPASFSNVENYVYFNTQSG